MDVHGSKGSRIFSILSLPISWDGSPPLAEKETTSFYLTMTLKAQHKFPYCIRIGQVKISQQEWQKRNLMKETTPTPVHHYVLKVQKRHALPVFVAQDGLVHREDSQEG